MLDNWGISLLWLSVLSLVMFAGSILIAWILVLRLPVDFVNTGVALPRRHPAWHMVVMLVRNVFGVLLVSSGVIMLFTPGQGVLFIFLGLTLMDFPGKSALVRRLLGKPGILNTLNRIRQRSGRPALSAAGNAHPVEKSPPETEKSPPETEKSPPETEKSPPER